MPGSALIVEVPEAEPLVGTWRAEHDWSAQHGVPAHITLLFPFLPAESVDDRLHAELRELFGSQPSFTFTLPRVARFPDVAWLAPEPAEPFSRLTQLIFERFPDYPPYEGLHDVVIPHLTVAEGDAELQDAVTDALTPSLPIEANVREATLIVEDDAGWWHSRERYALSTRSGSRPAG